jgi:alpha-beta hydrolase superfamily lysophospholipase/SAM-dependent methyltransferase
MTQPRVPQEHQFQTHDGVALAYRHWRADPSLRRRGAIVLVGGLQAPASRIDAWVDALDLPDFDFFACDARGRGPSTDLAHGSADQAADMALAGSVRDVQTFVDHLVEAHGVPTRELHVVGQEDGAVLAATWAHDHAPRIRGLTLASPAFETPLHGSRTAAQRLVADTGAIVLPVQLLVAGTDRSARRQSQRRFFDRLGSAVKTRLELPGPLLPDAQGARSPDSAEQAAQALRSFVLQLAEAPPAPVDLREAHLHGATADESRALAQGVAPLSARGLRRTFDRLGLGVGARLSRGLKLGRTSGFDSGATLDYIARNQPQGTGSLGRSIDRRYLESPMAQALRERRRHVEELLGDAMERLAGKHRDVRILDIAAGHGRYVLDAVAASPIRTSAVELRDIDEANVRAGQALIAERELQHLVRYTRADAFDRLALASLRPRPTIAVACGLYERFAENEGVRRSLAGVGDAVEDGGYLVYTGWPWHPRFETVARALAGGPPGEARVVRRRTQAELDQLVEEAGFVKIAQRIDASGLFTVSLALRRDEPAPLPPLAPR